MRIKQTNFDWFNRHWRGVLIIGKRTQNERQAWDTWKVFGTQNNNNKKEVLNKRIRIANSASIN